MGCVSDTGADTTLATIDVSSDDVITNNQDASIDEGDIVKKLGRLLLILRRGHLYVIDTGERGAEHLVAIQDYTLAGSSRHDNIWYDEILTFDGGAALLGFNYEADAAEVFVFSLDPQNGLQPRGRWRFAVEDYYSGEDYGARIRGNELVLSFSLDAQGLLEGKWPTAARVGGDDKLIEASKTDLLRPDDIRVLDDLGAYPQVLAFLKCDLGELLDGRFDCRSAAVVANEYSTTYVAADAEYVADLAWTHKAYQRDDFNPWWWPDDALPADLYQSRVVRLAEDPLESPGVVTFAGATDDRFSFKEEANGLYLVALEHPEAKIWTQVLQYIPTSAFQNPHGGKANERARIDGRARLVRMDDNALWMGLYESPDDDEYDGRAGRLVRQPLAGGAPIEQVLPFPAARIEMLRDHVLLFGTTGDRWEEDPDAVMTVLADKWTAHLGPERRYPDIRFDASDRSHAFNAAHLSDGVDVAGIPVSGGRSAEVRERLGNVIPPDDILLLRRVGDGLEMAGRVDMTHFPSACEKSCWDWYGNARFFAFDDRLFAWSGDLIKELRLDGAKLWQVSSLRLEQSPH